jgi:hypothetical protein
MRAPGLRPLNGGGEIYVPQMRIQVWRFYDETSEYRFGLSCREDR